MTDSPSPRAKLTLLATTDLHGALRNWDYFTDQPLSAPGSLAQVSTVIEEIRQQRPSGTVLVFDVGDTIQGTPVMSYAAAHRVRPHPMAAAMNHLSFDAAAIGNHDFNYGLDFLADFIADCEFPVLAGNVTSVGESGQAGHPLFAGTHLLTVQLPDIGAVRIGVLGLTNPGSILWDRLLLEDVAQFDGIVQSAGDHVAALRRDGADLVVALSHSGLGPSSTYGDALPWPENATRELAQRVPGLDAVFCGHAHVEVCEAVDTIDGREVYIVEPLCYGRRLGLIEFELERDADVRIVRQRAEILDTSTAVESPTILTLTASVHDAVREDFAHALGELSTPLVAVPATERPSEVIDLVNHVQARTVMDALRDTAYADTRVFSVTAPNGFARNLPAGAVRVRDIAGMYPFDNTVQAVVITGAELRAYLEHAGRYFQALQPRVPFYNYDILGSASGTVSYTFVGQHRAVPAIYVDDVAISDTETLVLALNNYRWGGGGNYPTTGHPTIFSDHVGLRERLLHFVQANSPVRMTDIGHTIWRIE